MSKNLYVITKNIRYITYGKACCFPLYIVVYTVVALVVIIAIMLQAVFIS